MLRAWVLTVLSAAMVTATMAVAHANETGPVKATLANSEFILHVHAINAAEVQMGQVAEQHVLRGSTLALAVKMINDHTQLDGNLAKLAAQEKLDLPVQLDAVHQTLINGLSNTPDAQFDAAYINAVVLEQKQMISLLEAEDKREHTGPYQTFVADALPILRNHVILAEQALVRLQTPEGFHASSSLTRP